MQNDTTAALHRLHQRAKFPPLEAVTAPTVSTEAAAFYLLRQPQTLRGWACSESGPIKPVRLHGRLGWPTAKLREMLGLEMAV